MPANRIGQARFARRPGRPHGRENAPAGRVELLVGGAGGPQLELVDAVAGKAGVRVAVDQPREGAQTTTVELLELPVGFPKARIKLAHRAAGSDSSVLAEDVRVAHDLDGPERFAAKRGPTVGGRRELCEVADEQAPPARPVAHSADWGCIGGSIPCSAANAIASG